MAKFYGTLVSEYGRCEAGCAGCEEACIQALADGKGARIQAVHLPETGFHGVVKCIQCSDPGCREFCPTGAITKSEEDGIGRINEDKCIGCGLCTLGCPYGGIYYDPEIKKSYKCDKCDGQPRCVDACEAGVLSYAEGGAVFEQLGEELQSRGIGMCQGCGEELAIRMAIRTFGKQTIAFMGPGCTPSAFSGTSLGNTVSIPTMNAYMTNLPAIASGVRRYFRKIGQEATLVAFAGDGLTADVGFQCLSGAAERGENIIYICLDNEAYMNTGIQRSATTPAGGWTTTTPIGETSRGKKQKPKYMPLLMALHGGVSYVATVSPYYLQDYIDKLVKAKAVKDGMAYIHVLSPCPTGWRSPIDSMVELSKLAVETNYFPLWESDHGQFRFTYLPKKPRPVKVFTSLMGRFSHLSDRELQAIQDMADERFHQIQLQCRATDEKAGKSMSQ
ncbi:MAG: 4Fe-4S dicluster domain-containing protein [Deltaproteobacteria bacterium]|nr:4Fe-4S dicluster domain-containing protein [Deltaproteobacteria bacterium]